MSRNDQLSSVSQAGALLGVLKATSLSRHISPETFRALSDFIIPRQHANVADRDGWSRSQWDTVENFSCYFGPSCPCIKDKLSFSSEKENDAVLSIRSLVNRLLHPLEDHQINGPPNFDFSLRAALSNNCPSQISKLSGDRITQLRNVIKNSVGSVYLNWPEAYRQESELWTCDRIFGPHNRCAVFGHQQAAVPIDHRSNIAKWLADACKSAKWSRQTFHAAVIVFDKYILGTAHKVSSAELGCLATAALFIAAHIKEAAPDDSIITLDRFRKLCPEVGTPSEIREAQCHIVETTQGCLSFGGRTPFDLCLQAVATIFHEPSLAGLCEELLRTQYDVILFEVLAAMTDFYVISGFALIAPPSLLVIATAIIILEVFCDYIGSENKLKHKKSSDRFGCENSIADYDSIVFTSRLKIFISRRVFSCPGGYRCLHPICQSLAPLVSDGLLTVLNLANNNPQALPKGSVMPCWLFSSVLDSLPKSHSEMSIQRQKLQNAFSECKMIGRSTSSTISNLDVTLSLTQESLIESGFIPFAVSDNIASPPFSNSPITNTDTLSLGERDTTASSCESTSSRQNKNHSECLFSPMRFSYSNGPTSVGNSKTNSQNINNSNVPQTESSMSREFVRMSVPNLSDNNGKLPCIKNILSSRTTMGAQPLNSSWDSATSLLADRNVPQKIVSHDIKYLRRCSSGIPDESSERQEDLTSITGEVPESLRCTGVDNNHDACSSDVDIHQSGLLTRDSRDLGHALQRQEPAVVRRHFRRHSADEVSHQRLDEWKIHSETYRRRFIMCRVIKY